MSLFLLGKERARINQSFQNKYSNLSVWALIARTEKSGGVF
tara:strand:+ start:418 stop:540 length:123 start_codon:yes stop_codon:yes gene_type:complete